MVVIIVSVGHLFSHLYLLAFPPLFPLITADLGLTNTQLGLLVSVMYVVMVLFQTPFGLLVDAIGAKPIFVFGLVVTGGGTALAGAADSLTGTIPVYWLLLFAALVMGVGQSTFHPADYPLVDVVSEETNQGKHFAVHMFAGYMGFAFAPLLIGGLGLTYGWPIALLTIGAVGVLYGLVSQLVLSTDYADHMDTGEKKSGESNDAPRIRESLRTLVTPGIFLSLVFFFTTSIGTIGISTFTVVYVTQGFGFSEVVGNTTLSVYMVLAALGVLMGGVLADRIRIRPILTSTMLLATGAVLMPSILNVNSPLLLVAMFGGLGFLYGLSVPARDRLVTLVTPSDSVGASFGLISSGLSLAGLTAPLIIGFTIDTVNVFVGFAIIPLGFIVSALVAAYVRL